MQTFIDQIVKNLEGNGFPAKRVSLPMEKMFEIADSKGFSFNAVMDKMRTDLGIDGEIQGEKILFSKVPEVQSTDGLDLSGLGDMFKGGNSNDMMAKAQEMMAKMDPAELERMQQMFMNMSEDEKADIMKKGRDMGLM